MSINLEELFSKGESIKSIARISGHSLFIIKKKGDAWAASQGIDSYSCHYSETQQRYRDNFSRAMRIQMMPLHLSERDLAFELDLDPLTSKKYFEGVSMPQSIQRFCRIVTYLGIDHLMEGGSND